MDKESIDILLTITTKYIITCIIYKLIEWRMIGQRWPESAVRHTNTHETWQKIITIILLVCLHCELSVFKRNKSIVFTHETVIYCESGCNGHFPNCTRFLYGISTMRSACMDDKHAKHNNNMDFYFPFSNAANYHLAIPKSKINI